MRYCVSFLSAKCQPLFANIRMRTDFQEATSLKFKLEVKITLLHIFIVLLSPPRMRHVSFFGLNSYVIRSNEQYICCNNTF